MCECACACACACACVRVCVSVCLYVYQRQKDIPASDNDGNVLCENDDILAPCNQWCTDKEVIDATAAVDGHLAVPRPARDACDAARFQDLV